MNIPSLSRRKQPAPAGDVTGDGRVDARDTATGTIDRTPVTDPTDRTEPQPIVDPTDRTEPQPVVEPTDRTEPQPVVEPTDRTEPRPTVDPTDRTEPRPVVTDRDADRATYRSSTAPAGAGAAALSGRGGAAPVAEPATERTMDLEQERVNLQRERLADRDGDGIPDRRESTVGDATAAPVAVGPKPRASLLATVGLVAGVAGALFVLTGTLAGYGIALGALGAVLSVLGLIATRRRHVAGKTDALLGIVLGLGAVVLGVLAMTGLFDWPTTDGDWVGRFREWLDSQFVDRF
ncbi:thrombospondin [Micromonospora mirobrigensis]|uniref:Thrombospondin n=1 Tax=Micromonospora mirobrigensis TaxID=262898 RepID=A0A1C4XRE1_9ACTN|nr:thrombospondin [Micromonospora mirobrigensis]SCF11057.1 hypothetical protein GA0070564_103284 [Micromonospora mirobrigensis]